MVWFYQLSWQRDLADEGLTLESSSLERIYFCKVGLNDEHLTNIVAWNDRSPLLPLNQFKFL